VSDLAVLTEALELMHACAPVPVHLAGARVRRNGRANVCVLCATIQV
jgi:hypothetical protein